MKKMILWMSLAVAVLSFYIAMPLLAVTTGNASDVPAVVTIISNNPTPPSGMPGPDEADSTKAK